jgi:hypothetical protein
MVRRMRYLNILFFAAWGFTAAGCALTPQPKEVGDYPGEITDWERVARESPELKERAQANLELARLYRNHRNPHINYAKSRRALETYLLLEPVEGKTDEVLDWLTVFQALDGLQNEKENNLKNVETLKRQKAIREKSLNSQMKGEEYLQTDIQQLREQMEMMEKTVLSLQAENGELKGANRSLKETNSGLIEANKNLQADNQQMRATLERLKKLDQQMEERREQIK